MNFLTIGHISLRSTALVALLIAAGACGPIIPSVSKYRNDGTGGIIPLLGGESAPQKASAQQGNFLTTLVAAEDLPLLEEDYVYKLSRKELREIKAGKGILIDWDDLPEGEPQEVLFVLQLSRDLVSELAETGTIRASVAPSDEDGLRFAIGTEDLARAPFQSMNKKIRSVLLLYKGAKPEAVPNNKEKPKPAHEG